MTKEQFDQFVANIPAAIDDLKKNLPADISSQLDGSLGSIDVLEKYLMGKYDIKTMTEPANEPFLKQLASYVGHVAEKEMKDSFWTINLSDEEEVNYGFPLLKFPDERAYFNPFTYITMSLDRKRGNLISNGITKRKG